MSIRNASMLLAALLALTAARSHAADPADFPALEWLSADDALAQVRASDGVVFVDLFAHY